MNALIDKNISQSKTSSQHRIRIDNQPDDNSAYNDSLVERFKQWLYGKKRWNHKSMSEAQMVMGNNTIDHNNEIVCINDIPFVIPRRLEEIRQETTEDFERAKLIIRRMDEYLVSPEEQDEAKRQRHLDTSLGLCALASAANSIQKISFREVLSVDESLPDTSRRLSIKDGSVKDIFRRVEKNDPITDFQEAHDLIEFEEALTEHSKNLLRKDPFKLSDMLYLKFCLMLELQRDENESCLRILLHDIIFKFHLKGFRLRCQIHVKKPIEHELTIEKVVNESHLTTNYAAQFIIWSGDWIVQQDVDLYIVMKVESLSINKYIGPKFWDMAHLHVKNVPHGASRIFLRELTPVTRPSKILSRGINVGQVEIEAGYWPDKCELSIHIVKVSHSQAERLLRAPETFVEVVFQGPFDIFEIKQTKVADRSLNPKFDEEFFFQIPDKTAVSDITVDLIFLEKSSISSHPGVLGVLTISKHTDWYPMRKFWADVEENPNMKLKSSFLFEGNVDE
ncbi:unnamed protein product [Rotaria socialis]|uniref:C2 domain-containing protein n=1 Tax=Rotaria socialis TaxID=392032 RepID=A0A817U497_9BILA|nr:unnamed protein product [Rotaria socialis]CAF3218998.1 unnamed protein product [Rotaria socialis]CAF3307869.1 unnamed protein product [Rotaria socialis]CAF3326398.1 unnamed protein product [Rotaria socialis]CAF4103735.1 unnamed protein product [Rotaria socialis]